VSFIVQNAEGM